MSLNISTNTAALRAGSYLSTNNARLQKSLDRLASGRKLASPVDDPGGLAVSMKLSAAINRLQGAQNNVQNAISFLEVQDGMLDTVGKIVDRMSELKGLASSDPMKSDADIASYNNEFIDLQGQLYSIAKQEFNGVSLFAEHTTKTGTTGTLFGGDGNVDHTLTVYTSADGASGSKISMHKSVLLSALTFNSTTFEADEHDDAVNTAGDGDETTSYIMTLASSRETNGHFLNLDDISVDVLTQALENVSVLRAQNGGTHSRLAFNAETLSLQKTNMRAALGRMVDVDIAEETTNLAKYSILNQAAATMLAQANASTDVALILLR